MSAFKKQINGNHYSKLKIQPTQYIIENKLGYIEGNVIKYVSRHRYKDRPLEDLKKAKWYIERLIQNLEKEKKC